MERMKVYVRGNAETDAVREYIESIPNSVVEELKTVHNDTKFEFFGTMIDCLRCMQLGASSSGKV